MKLIWGPVRRICHMYGVSWRGWFIGIAKRYDPGVILEGEM